VSCALGICARIRRVRFGIVLSCRDVAVAGRANQGLKSILGYEARKQFRDIGSVQRIQNITDDAETTIGREYQSPVKRSQVGRGESGASGLPGGGGQKVPSSCECSELYDSRYEAVASSVAKVVVDILNGTGQLLVIMRVRLWRKELADHGGKTEELRSTRSAAAGEEARTQRQNRH
jgi:hypothetical protein